MNGENERRIYISQNKNLNLHQFQNRIFFFLIKEKGNPNEHEFTEKIGVLYSLAYAVRMIPKQGYTPAGYFEYTVYPLEGIWDLTERVRN